MRRGGGGGAVEGFVRGEDGADDRSAWGANHDASKGSKSTRGASQETGIRAGCGTNASAEGSADSQAHQGMQTALGAGQDCGWQSPGRL